MGCYPIFAARNWHGLGEDISSVGRQLVSIALVTDPFGDYTQEQLHGYFDRVVPFKEHFVADFSKPLRVSKHHVYYAKKAASNLRVEVSCPPQNFCADWNGLYEGLVRRKGLKGIKAFSRVAFELQLRIPGIVVARAIENATLVGAHLWYEQDDVAYSHLAAATDRGYQLNCSYAIYSAALEFFRARVKRLDLGAGAGAAIQQNGLSWFKRGWSNSLQTAYFCGKILNPERYDSLVEETHQQNTSYFPAYRSGEFA
jgi:hypothetical protein